MEDKLEPRKAVYTGTSNTVSGALMWVEENTAHLEGRREHNLRLFVIGLCLAAPYSSLFLPAQLGKLMACTTNGLGQARGQ